MGSWGGAQERLHVGDGILSETGRKLGILRVSGEGGREGIPRCKPAFVKACRWELAWYD